MPSKHIRKETWDLFIKKRIAGIVGLESDIRERDLLDLVIRRGLDSVKDKDLKDLSIKEYD